MNKPVGNELLLESCLILDRFAAAYILRPWSMFDFGNDTLAFSPTMMIVATNKAESTQATDHNSSFSTTRPLPSSAMSAPSPTLMPQRLLPLSPPRFVLFTSSLSSRDQQELFRWVPLLREELEQNNIVWHEVDLAQDGGSASASLCHPGK